MAVEIKRAIDAVERCEADLRSALAEAASAGDYDLVIKLTSWARQLAKIRESEKVEVVEVTVHPSGRASARPQRRTSDYPRFGQRGDYLVKIGWSKKDRAEYEHKVPRTVVHLMLGAMLEAGRGGRVFPLTDILPLRGPNAAQVPDYQSYIVTAWLRLLGVIDQHGRRGYSVVRADELRQTVDSAWHVLPSV